SGCKVRSTQLAGRPCVRPFRRAPRTRGVAPGPSRRPRDRDGRTGRCLRCTEAARRRAVSPPGPRGDGPRRRPPRAVSVRAPVARPIRNGTLLAGLQALRLLVGGESPDELVELALENLVETPDGETDAVIGDPVLLVVVGPDLLR